MNNVIKAVEGFDDYRESFWSLASFFERIIAKYSPKVVLQAVKACNTVYNTKRSSDNLVTGWADVCTNRCVVWLSSATREEIVDISFLQTVKDVRTILTETIDAGKEFHSIVKSKPELLETVAKVKQYLDQPTVGGKNLKADEKANIKKVRKEICHIEGLACDAAEGIITAFEQAVDMDHPTGSILYKATCAMCYKQDADLALQVRAAQGSLAKLALQAINNQTEADPGEQFLLAEAVGFIHTLLVPWDRADGAHMETKKQIATTLQQLNVLDALLRQLRFWKVDWNCSFGNCGNATVVSVLELARYFPEIIDEKINPDADLVSFIRYCAERHRVNTAYRVPYETAYSASVILECLLEGKPEPPPPTAEQLDRWARPWMYNNNST